MRSTVDSGEDECIRVQSVSVELAGVSQFKDTLTHLKRGTVNLVKEQSASIIATVLKPVRRVEPRGIAFDRRQTDKVAFRHLRGATLNHLEPRCLGVLIHHFRLTQTVTTTDKDRLLDGSDERNDLQESLEINGHCVLQCVQRVFCPVSAAIYR